MLRFCWRFGWLVVLIVGLAVRPVRAWVVGGFELPEKRDKPKPAFVSLRLEANFTEPVTRMKFIRLPGGYFNMGSNDGASVEKPVHKVWVDGFWMGMYEVTQGQWKKIMGSNPSRFKKGDNYPVENVSWNDCQAFIEKLNAKSIRKFRLPTEAEWEYASRSGGKNEKYAGGDDVGLVAWYRGNSGGLLREHSTHPVGGKAANGFGLHDMSGNVWEWCADWYDKNYYSHSPERNPMGPCSGLYRVNRGGGWNDEPWHVRSTNRFKFKPSFFNGGLGFRLVSSGQ